MTHVKALQPGHSSQGTSEPITPGSPPVWVLLSACLVYFGVEILVLPNKRIRE